MISLSFRRKKEIIIIKPEQDVTRRVKKPAKENFLDEIAKKYSYRKKLVVE